MNQPFETDVLGFKDHCKAEMLIILTHHKACPDCDHQFKPGWKFGDYFGNKSGNGVPVVRFMELCLIKTVNQDYVVFFR